MSDGLRSETNKTKQAKQDVLRHPKKLKGGYRIILNMQMFPERKVLFL